MTLERESVRELEGALCLPELELELTQPGTEKNDNTLKRNCFTWLESRKKTIQKVYEKLLCSKREL